MADKIISFDKKILLDKEKRSAYERRRKILAVRKIFHCTQCLSKCEKCGTQVSLTTKDVAHRANGRLIPYRFCDSCREEYIDYIKRLQGKGSKDKYWHNYAWLSVWQTWIEYKNSIDQYMKSKEFIKLLNELRDDEA